MIRWLHLVPLLALAGCFTYHRGDFVALSTRAIPSDMEIRRRDVEGRSCALGWEPRFQLAVEDALDKVPSANALVNAEYRYERFCIVVSGTAVRMGSLD